MSRQVGERHSPVSKFVAIHLSAKYDNGRSISPGGAVIHSERSRVIDYLVTEPNTITRYRYGLEEIDKSDNAAIYGYFSTLRKEIEADYSDYHKKKMQAKTELFYEGIIAFGREQFEAVNDPQLIFESCMNYCELLEKKTGAIVVMGSLHMDEGHIDIDDQLQKNYHFHLLLVNYNPEIHRTALRNAKIKVAEIDKETKQPTGKLVDKLYRFKHMQDDLAAHFSNLGFERGIDYAKANLEPPKNINHRSYRKMKIEEQEKTKQLCIDIETQLKPLEELANEIQQTEDLPAVETYSQLTEVITEHLSQKDKIINEFQERLESIIEPDLLKAFYNQTRNELKATKEAKQSDYSQLKQEYEAAASKLKNLSNQIIKSNNEIDELKQKLANSEDEITELAKIKDYLQEKVLADVISKSNENSSDHEINETAINIDSFTETISKLSPEKLIEYDNNRQEEQSKIIYNQQEQIKKQESAIIANQTKLEIVTQENQSLKSAIEEFELHFYDKECINHELTHSERLKSIVEPLKDAVALQQNVEMFLDSQELENDTPEKSINERFNLFKAAFNTMNTLKEVALDFIGRVAKWLNISIPEQVKHPDQLEKNIETVAHELEALKQTSKPPQVQYKEPDINFR